METFESYCKNYILDNIDGYEGLTDYACEIGWRITQGPNADGTLTFSRAAALDYLREWWAEAADYFDYEKNEFGSDGIHNPFDDAEGYMVCMVINKVNEILSQVSIISDNWDEEITLTPENIAIIKNEIENE